MISVLLIEKNGTVKEQKIKSFDKNDFYKKCGFKKPDNFEQRTVWKKMKVGSDLVNLTLYAKKNGRFGFENKYDLPPPVDSELYFGTMLIAGEDAELDKPYSLSTSIWEKVYEKLFGGFEDITQTDDEEEEDELANVPAELKTKNGYLKDGFVVEDNMLSPTHSTEDDEETAEETDEQETDEHETDEHETDEQETDEEEGNFDSELECEEYEYEGHD